MRFARIHVGHGLLGPGSREPVEPGSLGRDDSPNLLRRLMRVRLNVRVDESQGGSRGLQHAPASHPFVRPLQLFGRDGEWIDDPDPALAQAIDAEPAGLRIWRLMM